SHVVLDREGADLRFDRLGARDHRLHHLDRRELACLEAAERLGGAQIAEFDVRHDSPQAKSLSPPRIIAGWLRKKTVRGAGCDARKKIARSGCRSAYTDPTL